jgi:hypothetical protein
MISVSCFPYEDFSLHKAFAGSVKKPFTSEKWQRFGFALFSTLLIMVFVKIPIERFNIELLTGHSFDTLNEGIFFANDLDNDGNSESVYVYQSQETKKISVVYYNFEGLIIQAYNFFNHNWTPISVPAFYDINDDNINELLIITTRNDSLFFNALNLISGKFYLENMFIGKVERPGKQLTYRARFIDFEDYTRDGEKELYFMVDAGYGLNPRGLYRLDVKSFKLYKTPQSYIVWDLSVFHDFNSDGIPEILVNNYAPMNVHFETEYTDNNVWLTAFDLELNYLFKPVAMPKGYGGLHTVPATFCDTLFFAIFVNNSDDNTSDEVLLVDFKGNIITRKSVFKNNPTINILKPVIFENKNYLVIKNIGRFELTPDLKGLPDKKVKKQWDYQSHWFEKSWFIDVDNDGQDERIFYNADQLSIEIINSKKKLSTFLRLPFNRMLIQRISPFFKEGKINRLMVSTNSGYFFLSYLKIHITGRNT